MGAAEEAEAVADAVPLTSVLLTGVLLIGVVAAGVATVEPGAFVEAEAFGLEPVVLPLALALPLVVGASEHAVRAREVRSTQRLARISRCYPSL